MQILLVSCDLFQSNRQTTVKLKGIRNWALSCQTYTNTGNKMIVQWSIHVVLRAIWKLHKSFKNHTWRIPDPDSGRFIIGQKRSGIVGLNSICLTFIFTIDSGGEGCCKCNYYNLRQFSCSPMQMCTAKPVPRTDNQQEVNAVF